MRKAMSAHCIECCQKSCESVISMKGDLTGQKAISSLNRYCPVMFVGRVPLKCVEVAPDLETYVSAGIIQNEKEIALSTMITGETRTKLLGKQTDARLASRGSKFP